MSNVFDNLPVVIFASIEHTSGEPPVELRFTAGIRTDKAWEPSPEGGAERTAPGMTVEQRRRDAMGANQWIAGDVSPNVVAAILMALARNDRSSYQVIEPFGDMPRYLSIDLGVLTYPAKTTERTS